MPLIKSAIKRVRQTKKRQTFNNLVKTKYKALVKNFLKLLSSAQTDEAAKLMPSVQKALDTAAKKNILHKNAVGHKKSSLQKALTHAQKNPKNATDTPVVKKEKTTVAKKAAPAKKVSAKTTARKAAPKKK